MSPAASSPVSDDTASDLDSEGVTARPPQTAETPLPSPRALASEYPPTPFGAQTIREARQAVRRLLRREDDRFLVIVGPCSIHDTDAALEYAERLAILQRRHRERLLLVMRTYLEKPRTTVGWRGLVNDPYLDGSFDMAEGLRRARVLLTQITAMGLPVAAELLDIAAAGYLTDLVSVAAIGARTTESQPHRALASSLSLPVGFKNGTDGGIQVALDAMVSADAAHSYLGMDAEGRCCVVKTAGNPDTLLVLRGGRGRPNHDPESIEAAERQMDRLGFLPALLVDCSHANSGYDPTLQPAVCASVAAQRRSGRRSLVGVMIESNLHCGKQSLDLTASGAAGLRYGVSVTDACADWETTVEMIDELDTTLA